MGWLIDILKESWQLYYLAAPFILFGLFLAGLFHVVLSPKQVIRWMGGPGLSDVARAAFIGIPLPLCSCGIFPVSIALRRKGASAPSTASFLITTPETSADAIVLTWGILGPVMAIVRPIAAFLTGMLAGVLAIAYPPPDPSTTPAGGPAQLTDDDCCGADGPPDEDDLSPDYVGIRGFGASLRHSLRRLIRSQSPDEEGEPTVNEPRPFGQVLTAIGRQSFVRSLDDIAFWLSIGIILAGVISVVVPADLDAWGLGSGIVPMLIIVVIAVPMYTCASSSTPIAASLVAKGLSPGAALVFLLAGPAASTASMLLVGKHFGGKFLRIYLAAVILGSIGTGLALDALLVATGWQVIPRLISHSEGLVAFVQLLCAITLSALIIWRLFSGAARHGLIDLRNNLAATREFFRSNGIVRHEPEPGSRKTTHSSTSFPIRRIGWIAIAAIGAAYLGSGFTAVPSDSLGYGKLFGQVIQRDMKPGLHWTAPRPFGSCDIWRVHYPRKSDVGFSTSLELIGRRSELARQAPPNEWHSPVSAMNSDPRVATYLTGDENLLQLSFTVHYFLIDPYRFFYELNKDIDLVGLYAETVARRIIGSRPLETLLTAERATVEEAIETELQLSLDSVGSGVGVRSVHIVDIHPPQAAVVAFRDVSSAREDQQTRIHRAYESAARDIPLARGTAQLETAQVEAEADASVAEAGGQSVGYRSRAIVYSRYRDVLHELLWLETTEKVLSGRRKFIVPPGTESGGVTLWQLDPPTPLAPEAVPSGSR